ncbi:hypothetical protein [Vreelandella jeotgali]|uniref:hypothetical protein n=1 Tax=Vreelandella jeotgali TaxID=553386 RepID=UPI00034D896E|nr:hypothetical protein [Halomonas jeotgali]
MRFYTYQPTSGRCADWSKTIRDGHLPEENLENVRTLNAIAERRGQSLAQATPL